MDRAVVVAGQARGWALRGRPAFPVISGTTDRVRPGHSRKIRIAVVADPVASLRTTGLRAANRSALPN